MNKYTDEQIEFIKKIIKGKTSNEILHLFYDKFHINLKQSQLKYIKHKYALKSNVDTKFKINSTPYNKKPIGYEFKSTGGYIWIKIEEPNKFIQKQRYVYEQYYGKIPSNKSVIFLNKNKEDFDINNLALIDNCDKLVAKNLKLFSTNSDITKIGINLAKLINKTYRKEKVYDK